MGKIRGVGNTNCAPSGVVCPPLVPTLLSPVAPKSCQRATVATPRETALTGRLNQVRKANGSQTLGEFGTSSACKDRLWRTERTRPTVGPMVKKVVSFR